MASRFRSLKEMCSACLIRRAWAQPLIETSLSFQVYKWHVFSIPRVTQSDSVWICASRALTGAPIYYLHPVIETFALFGQAFCLFEPHFSVLTLFYFTYAELVFKCIAAILAFSTRLLNHPKAHRQQPRPPKKLRKCEVCPQQRAVLT